MKRNKILLGSTALLIALMTAGCHKPSQSSANDKSSVKTSKVSHTKASSREHEPGSLSADDLTPKETLAVVTAYGAKKYDWSDIVKDAKKTHLGVAFLNRDKYPKIDKGQGYVYELETEDYSYDARYTLEGDGSSQVIYFYDGQDYLGSNTISGIVKYLNKINCDDLVSDLADGAVLGSDESDDSDTNDSDNSSEDSNSSESSSSLPGDAGLFTTPSEMRGNWYSSGDGTVLTINAHQLTMGSTKYSLHKQSSNFDPQGRNPDKYENIGNASSTDVDGMTAIAVRGWVQAAGAYNVYAYTTAKGHPVVLGLTSTGQLEKIFWDSKADANKYSNVGFTTLEEFEEWK